MDNHKNNLDSLILRVDKGNNIVENIVSFCHQNNIRGAWLQGLGAVNEAKLALYDLKQKKYHKKYFKGSFEIANLVGNIGIFNGKTVAHIHIVLSDQNMIAFGGHLEEARVAATCEIKLDVLDVELTRKFDPKSGLNLIKLD